MTWDKNQNNLDDWGPTATDAGVQKNLVLYEHNRDTSSLKWEQPLKIQPRTHSRKWSRVMLNLLFIIERTETTKNIISHTKTATCDNKVHFLVSCVNLLGHDSSHVDGKEGWVPFLLLRGRVNRKELQGEPKSMSQFQPTHRLPHLNPGVKLDTTGAWNKEIACLPQW